MKKLSLIVLGAVWAIISNSALAEEGTRVSGDVLEQWVNDGYTIAGNADRQSVHSVLLTSYPGGAFVLDWRKAWPDVKNHGTRKGTSTVKGDQLCRDYEDKAAVSCRRFTKVGPSKYFSFDEDGRRRWVFFMLRGEGAGR